MRAFSDEGNVLRNKGSNDSFDIAHRKLSHENFAKDMSIEKHEIGVRKQECSPLLGN